MKSKAWMVGMVSLVALGAGCASSGDDQPDESVVERTIVHRHADGTETVTTEEITVEQARAEVAARERAAIGTTGQHTEAVTQDTGCAGASTWLWDSTGQTGREICFYSDGTYGAGGGGFVNLGSYCRIRRPVTINGKTLYFCTAYWSGAVRSYWAGSQGGYFEHSAPPNCNEYFSTYQKVDSAGSCAQSADTLALNPILQ